MKAILNNYRQPPRKVRLVADLIRGKSVLEARSALRFLAKKSSPAIGKLLDSAVANARVAGKTPEELFIKSVTVNKGLVMKRYRPFARGRSGTLRKILSSITLELATAQKAEKSPKRSATKNSSKLKAKS